MKIGAVANETGLSISNIRFYEKKGLLAPARKEESGYRDYTSEDVARLKTILLYRKMSFSIETIYLIFQESIPLEVALERQTQELLKQKQEITASLELCERISRDTNFQSINVDAYLEYVVEEEEKGKQFVEIKEIIDDFTEYSGLRNYVQGNGYITKILGNSKVIRVISSIWLGCCMLLPVFALWESYKTDGFVSSQIVAFYIMWIVVVLVPFFQYHFKDKGRGART